MTAKARPVPKSPAGLGTDGKRLWVAIWSDLADDWTLDAREIELLARACTTADHIAALEEVVASEGVTAAGSRGQVVAHPALQELRQHKLVFARLLGLVELVDPAESRRRSATPRQMQARRAAEARWGRRRAS